MHAPITAGPDRGRRRTPRKRRALAAALLAALICAPFPLPPPSASADTADGREAVAPSARQKPGDRVEAVEERTESTTTWLNADGTTTVESYTGPIRVKNEDGGWSPIDTTLVADGGIVRPRTAAADITFSGGGEDERLAEVSRGGKSFDSTGPASCPNRT
ncbi:hypothetical protein ACFVH9_03685 [Streptomyces hirsutus]|uniref:hypothetical protein n=1 Tax=Streptomyces hirsutus TaxID=35620 RepID=UPI0036352D90